MTRIVVDASALAALVFQEPEGDGVRQRLDGAMVFAPELLRYELANTAWKKVKRQPADAAKILTALFMALDDTSGLIWQDVNARDVVLLAHATGTTAYDASYLWLAASLGADLVTLDDRLTKAVDVVASWRNQTLTDGGRPKPYRLTATPAGGASNRSTRGAGPRSTPRRSRRTSSSCPPSRPC